MPTFAFIGHYLGLQHFLDLAGWPGAILRCMPRGQLKRLIRVLPPYVYLRMPPLGAPSGQVAQGYGIIAPILPEDLVTWGEQLVLEKIIAAGRLAERLGAKIVGLAGFASVVGGEGEEVAKALKIAVTSGNSLTAALALQGMRKGAQMMGISMPSATVAVIGATGDIGSICTRMLAKEVGKLHLAARNAPRLAEFASRVTQESGCQISVMKYIRDAVREADLVLTATSAITTIIEAEDVKSGAVVCDVAIPHNVAADLVRLRDDVLVFEGGLAKLPVKYLSGNRRWARISPDGFTIFGCLAETMVLALENRCESYSLGRGNITSEQIHEIERLATRHGFGLAEFRYRDVTFSEERIRQIRIRADEKRSQAIQKPLSA